MSTPGNALGIINPEDDDRRDITTMFEDEEPGDVVNGQAPPGTPPAEYPEVFDENDLTDDEAAELERERQVFEDSQAGDQPVVQESETEEEEEEEESEDAQRVLQRFRTPEALANAYREIQGGFTRMAQDNRRVVEENEQLRQQLDAIQQDQATVAQAVQAILAEQDPETAAQLQAQLEQDRRVQEEVARHTAPLQQQLQRQQVVQQFQQVVDGFYAAHPDISPNSPEDQAFTAYTNELIGMMRGVGIQPNLMDPQVYDLAYEGFRNPTFGAELLLNPNAIRSPQALARLRERAGATIQREQQGPAPSQAGTRAGTRQPTARKRVESHVEQPSGGTPPGGGAPGRKPGDEFDEAAEWYQNRFSRRGPLFGGS